MLKPPLSLLSNKLLAFIVDHLAALPYSLEAIHDLSLANRAFTPICQNLTFRTLRQRRPSQDLDNLLAHFTEYKYCFGPRTTRIFVRTMTGSKIMQLGCHPSDTTSRFTTASSPKQRLAQFKIHQNHKQADANPLFFSEVSVSSNISFRSLSVWERLPNSHNADAKRLYNWT